MKKNERLLENKVRKLIRMLREAEEDSGAAGAEEFEPQPAQAQQPAPAQAQQPAIGVPRAMPTATNLKYLSTIDMFTTNYPPNSAEWTQEIAKKAQFRPLQDGRIVNFLKKQFPTFKVRRAAAARYSDVQFRVILYGDLKAPTVLKIETVGPKKVVVNIDSIKIDNKFTNPTGNAGVIETIKKKKVVLPGVDLKQLTDWTGITPEGEPEEPEKEKAKEAAAEQPAKKEAEAGTEAPLDKKHFADLVGALTNLGYPSKAAKAAAKEAMKTQGSPKTDEEGIELIKKAIAIANSGGAEEEEPEKPKPKQENASLDLHRYLKNLLVEKKGELEHGLGGEILAAVNDEVMEQWFGDNGMAATTSKRLFKGKGFEWFAAESATFVPEKRIVDKVEEGKQIQITLNGYFVIEAEIWIDARIEGQGMIDSWSFRILGEGAQVLKNVFKTPGIIPKAPKPPETT